MTEQKKVPLAEFIEKYKGVSAAIEIFGEDLIKQPYDYLGHISMLFLYDLAESKLAAKHPEFKAAIIGRMKEKAQSFREWNYVFAFSEKGSIDWLEAFRKMKETAANISELAELTGIASDEGLEFTLDTRKAMIFCENETEVSLIMWRPEFPKKVKEKILRNALVSPQAKIEIFINVYLLAKKQGLNSEIINTSRRLMLLAAGTNLYSWRQILDTTEKDDDLEEIALRRMAEVSKDPLKWYQDLHWEFYNAPSSRKQKVLATMSGLASSLHDWIGLFQTVFKYSIDSENQDLMAALIFKKIAELMNTGDLSMLMSLRENLLWAVGPYRHKKYRDSLQRLLEAVSARIRDLVQLESVG